MTTLLRFVFSTFYSFKFLLTFSVVVLGIVLLIIPSVLVSLRAHFRNKRVRSLSNHRSVAFFHPYCNAGGGGERVLWCAIRALQSKYSNLDIVVYTGDLEANPDEILKKAETRFNIKLKKKVQFVYLHKRQWVEASMYPFLTLLGQSIGSVVLGFEALCKFQPDIYIDTMGYAFTLPLFRYIGNCKVGCYIHYPTITKDMFKRVLSRTHTYNNRATIARSPFLTAAKLLYYRFFSMLYSWCGRSSQSIMVNSTWTEDHIVSLWEVPLETHRVYPPCDVDDLKKIDHAKTTEIRIVSVGQFRPEKDHPLQLNAMYELRNLLPDKLWEKVTLVFIGSCRNAEDRARVKDMQDLCKHLSLENNVEFKINATYEELLEEFEKATIGLHAMWNEHFGIGVVECMAAGLIMVAHRSGGPQMDIIETSEGSRTGYLATTAEEYAETFVDIMKLTDEQKSAIIEAARASVDRFTSKEFEKNFLRAAQPILEAKN